MIKKALWLLIVPVLSAVMMIPMATIAGHDVNIRQLQGGQYCGNGLFGDFVIRSEYDWKRIWGTVSGLTWPLPSAPTVDYEREMVIAVYRRGMTMQDRVLVDRIKARGRDYQVSVIRTTPDSKCGAARIITFPCRLVAVPRTSGGVKFTEKTEYGRCDRPKGRFQVPNVGPSGVPNIPGTNTNHQ